MQLTWHAICWSAGCAAPDKRGRHSDGGGRWYCCQRPRRCSADLQHRHQRHHCCEPRPFLRLNSTGAQTVNAAASDISLQSLWGLASSQKSRLLAASSGCNHWSHRMLHAPMRRPFLCTLALAMPSCLAFCHGLVTDTPAIVVRDSEVGARADLSAAARPVKLVSQAAVGLCGGPLHGCCHAALPAAVGPVVPGRQPLHARSDLHDHCLRGRPHSPDRRRHLCVPRGRQELRQGKAPSDHILSDWDSIQICHPAILHGEVSVDEIQT